MASENLAICATAPPSLSNVELPQKLSASDGGSFQLGRWSVGITAYGLLAWVYDYLFFSIVLWNFGLLAGSVILTLVTALIDYACLRFYNTSKNDWLAIEYLKSLKCYHGASLPKRAIGYLLRKTPPFVQLVVLTPYSNAFLTTAFLRDSAYDYHSLTRRDWVVFWTSFLFSQAYWILLVWLGIEGLSDLWAWALAGN